MSERIRWLTRWTCPTHPDGPVNYAEYGDWTEPGEICLDCETGDRVPVKDADGWTVPDTRPQATWQGLLEDLGGRELERLREQLNRPSILLGALRGQHDGKSNVVIPVIRSADGEG